MSSLRQKEKERYRRHLIAVERTRRDPKRILYSTGGEEDAFSKLLRNRLLTLELTAQTFADATEAVVVESAHSSRSTPTKTSKALVSRVLSGQRNLPLARVATWADVLETTTEKSLHTFTVLTVLANARRDLHRLLSEKNPTRQRLLPLVDAALAKQVKAMELAWETQPAWPAKKRRAWPAG